MMDEDDYSDLYWFYNEGARDDPKTDFERVMEGRAPKHSYRSIWNGHANRYDAETNKRNALRYLEEDIETVKRELEEAKA